MTNAEQDFRKIRFKSPEAVDKPWLSWFRDEFSRRMFQSDVEVDADAPFWLDATTRLLPELALYVGEASSMRTMARREAIEGETVGVTIVLSGGAQLRSRDAELVLEPGAAAFGRPVNMMATREETRLISLRLSPKLLAPLVLDLDHLSLVSLAGAAEPVRLLTRYLGMLDGEDRIASPEAARLAALHIHDLTALALGASGDVAALAGGRGGARGAAGSDQAGHPHPSRRPGPVGCRCGRAAGAQRTLYPQAVRSERHDLFRIRRWPATGDGASHADRPAPIRSAGWCHCARGRVWRPLVFQPHVPPNVRRHTVRGASDGGAARLTRGGRAVCCGGDASSAGRIRGTARAPFLPIP
jgi:hypothetical protein